MRFRVAPRFDKLAQIRLTRLKRHFAKIASKQLVSQPNAIGVDDITFTVVGDLLDLAIEEVSLDPVPSMLSGLPGKPMIRLSSFSEALVCGAKEESTSQRSSASSV